MRFQEAINKCAIGDGIYQESNPKKSYTRNNSVSLYVRVPRYRQFMEDWCVKLKRRCGRGI